MREQRPERWPATAALSRRAALQVVRNSEFPALPTMLGTYNDRAKSLKRLQRAAVQAQAARAQSGGGQQ